MYKMILLCCAGIVWLPLRGMQMKDNQIMPITASNNQSQSFGQTTISQSNHSICAKGACVLCFPLTLTADILCLLPLCCRLSPIQKHNESDYDWMERADKNIEPQARHRVAMKELHGNDAYSSLYRKIHALCYEKAPHHTQHCEAEWEHLCCFSKALIKFVRE